MLSCTILDELGYLPISPAGGPLLVHLLGRPLRAHQRDDHDQPGLSRWVQCVRKMTTAQWHMREAWRELMFADPDQQAKATRDPVAPAQRSDAARAKAARHALEDGTPANSFATLMGDLATIDLIQQIQS